MTNEFIITLGNYIKTTKATINDAVSYFNVSRSTIMNAINKKLIYLDPGLYQEVKNIQNFNEHFGKIKGGQISKATSTYTEEEILCLVKQMVENKFSLRELESITNIPSSTLYELFKRINDENLKIYLKGVYEYNLTKGKSKQSGKIR